MYNLSIIIHSLALPGRNGPISADRPITWINYWDSTPEADKPVDECFQLKYCYA